MRKVSVYLLILILIMQFFPQSLFAQSSIDIVNDESYEEETELEQVVLFANEIGGEIELYEDKNGEQIIQYLPDDIIVERLGVTARIDSTDSA